MRGYQDIVGFPALLWGLRSSDQRIPPKYRFSILDLDNLKRLINSMAGENTVYIAEFPIKFFPRDFVLPIGATYQIIFTRIKRQFCMMLLPLE